MVRLLKQFCRVGFLLAGASSAFAFALLGPNNEVYQDPANGFNPNPFYDTLSTGPKNLGEEYRRNTPVLYYSFDQNFLDFFGSNGVYAVEQAFAILNGITNASACSSNLSEFPLEAQRFNYRAQALGLIDVKSVTLNLLVEQLGLATPQRYTWVLHDRFQPTGTTCPNSTTYVVVKRNFDPLDELQYSSYINGTRYSYSIVEYCTVNASPTPPLLADAVEFPVDPLADTFTAVADNGLFSGGFFTGLTRDDMAGLRYLLRTNNANFESSGPNTVTVETNLSTSQLLFTSNLTLLADQALTNDAAALVTLNPGLVVARTTPFFANVITTNVFFVFTNFYFDPVGTPAHLVSVTVRTTNATTLFRHEFANVFTNHYATSGFVTVQTTNVSTNACGPFVPVGTICTNISSTTVVSNMLLGDYYLVPAQSNACGYSIVSTQLIQTIYVTNAPLVATNAPSTTNVGGQQFSQTTVYSYNQYAFVVHPVVCPSNSVALRQGVEKITFIRKDYDSLLGEFFYPVTNQYTLNTITNSTVLRLKAQRVLTQPDILFTAQDNLGGPGGQPTRSLVARNLPFSTTNSGAYLGLAGPGTIVPGTTFIYDKSGPIFENFNPSSLDEANAFPFTIWGSFDGSTNPPIVYPSGTSIANLENQVLIQVNPRYLPDGFRLAPYSARMQTVSQTPNWQPPYTWTRAPGSLGLPPGLGLSTDGLISGTPTVEGIFDFVIRVTDSQARTLDRSYSIRINP